MGSFAAVVSIVIVVSTTPANAEPVYFDHVCWTWNPSPLPSGYQADWEAQGTMYAPAGKVTSRGVTSEAYSSQQNDVCAVASGLTVESSVLMRPSIGGVLQGACTGGFVYSGYQSGSATVNGSCTRSSQWDQVRMDFGHRAWVTGSYYDSPSHVGVVGA